MSDHDNPADWDSTLLEFDQDGNLIEENLHPEIAEWNRKIMTRDLIFQKMSGITSYFRHFYEDLNELESIKLISAQRGKDASGSKYILAVQHPTVEDTVVRLAINQKQLDEQLFDDPENMFPFIPTAAIVKHTEGKRKQGNKEKKRRSKGA